MTQEEFVKVIEGLSCKIMEISVEDDVVRTYAIEYSGLKCAILVSDHHVRLWKPMQTLPNTKQSSDASLVGNELDLAFVIIKYWFFGARID